MGTLSLGELQQMVEGADLEAKIATGRDNRGQLPESFFESYSALANTDGGSILLGVEENAARELKVFGIVDVDRVHKELWDGVNNRQRVSVLRRQVLLNSTTLLPRTRQCKKARCEQLACRVSLRPAGASP